MRGHIRERAKNTYAIILDIGKDAQGKRKQQWHTFKGTKREAENEMARLITEQVGGTSVEPNKLTVGEYLQRWLRDYAAAAVAAQTYERYRIIVDVHLVPVLGGHKLAKLSPLHIQAYYTAALKGTCKHRPDRPLAARTVLHHHRVLREALGQAVTWRLLPNNPASAVEPPRPQRKEMATLTAEQAAVLIDASQGSHLHLPIILAVTTGLRKGEIFGLQWKDVDPDRATLQVRRSLESTAEGPRFKEPKTAHGRRVVALPAMAVEAIRRHRIRQNEMRLKLGPDYANEYDLICCHFDGRPVRYNLVRDFQALLKKAGLPKVRFHDLRHTHATFLLSQGVHPKIVSERLGHSNISITLDTYSHVMPEMQRDAASKIDGMLQRRIGS